MRKYPIRLVLWVAFAILLFLLAYVFLCWRFASSTPKNLWQIRSWRSYESSSTEISFEYPSGWDVTDTTFSAPPEFGSSANITYNVLFVCPPADQIITLPKGYANNCISFFTKSRLYSPPIGEDDESSLFVDFKHYFEETPENFSNFRIIEQTSTSDEDGSVRLLGYYRDADQMVGMYQNICRANYLPQCFITFKHVLDSIHTVQATM